MRSTIPIELTDQLLDEIWKIGIDRQPTEACGILLPTRWQGRQVFEMPNRSLRPQNSFEFRTGDLVMVLEDWFHSVGREAWNDVTLWHTHPAGGVGPSRTDMQCKVPEIGHLVVALTDEGPVPTWY